VIPRSCSSSRLSRYRSWHHNQHHTTAMTITMSVYTVSQKQQYTWLLIITLANVHWFTKFLLCQIPEEILYTNIIKIIHLTLNMFLHYLWKLTITVAANFNGILLIRPQNSSWKIWGHLSSSGLNPVTIKSEKQCSSAQKRIRDVSELKQWMIDMSHGLQQTVIDEACTSEWCKCLRACVCIKDGRSLHLL